MEKTLPPKLISALATVNKRTHAACRYEIPMHNYNYHIYIPPKCHSHNFTPPTTISKIPTTFRTTHTSTPPNLKLYLRNRSFTHWQLVKITALQLTRLQYKRCFSAIVCFTQLQYRMNQHQQDKEFCIGGNKDWRIIYQSLDSIVHVRCTCPYGLYVPALYKIFDEILVNAADNLIRDPTQNIIRVEVKRKEGSLSVWNNGAGLPIQLHREHKCYVPELVFGHLLTSDNYDDSEKKVVGGRNGYGAKLTNIFSTKFILETADSRSGKKYKQVWEKNMTVCHKPSITQNKSEDFTQVTFFPDFARFGMRNLEEDIVALMRRRAFDLAASTQGRCQVFLDGDCLGVTSFQDYVDLHVKPEMFRTCKVVNDRWEIAIGLTDGSGFQQVSFVNSINTSRGGTHVTYIADQVVSAILDKIGKQKSGGTLAVKSQHVKSYLWIFVNCLIENPAFDSQTKETLTSKRERFGSTCRLPEDLLEDVVSSGIIEALQEWSKAMGKNELAQHLNRSDLGLQKRLFGVPKLEDANLAGTKEGESCTLILTEGDSAKALAVAGLGVVGRDRYGVFPLRGKLRNVRELTVKQMLENKEIEQVLKIMALDASKDEYRDAKGLRYGSIMIMTDQDHDGSHIKGLIINFIQHWFPSLLRLPGFLKEFVTPIVKVGLS
ncbi:TOP2 [Symbiodinium microadriaticum]|nr:TOP2 [Symbiodinium microadriaticum]